MGKIVLVGRLAARDIRRRKAQAVLLLLAITAATTTLTLGLALNGVTSHPYQQTRAATHGPDVVAQLSSPLPQVTPGHGPGPLSQAQLEAGVKQLTRTGGVSGYTGPYPVASAILRAGGVGIAGGGGGRPAA